MRRALVTIAVLFAAAADARADELLQPFELPSTPHLDSAATILSDGRILLTGGYDDSAKTFLSTAEIFDPATKKWSATGSMATPRLAHAMATLPSGKVIASGGKTNVGMTSSAEIYDPATGTWTTIAPPSRPHHGQLAILSDGRAALLVVTSPSGVVPSLEILDPTTSTWAGIGPSTIRHSAPGFAPLPDGGALIVSLEGAERYEPGKGFRALVRPAVGDQPGIAALRDGRIVAVSGAPVMYTPSTDTWRALAGKNRGAGATVTELTDGRVLLVGGRASESGVPPIEILDPSTLAITALGGTLSVAGHATLPLPGGAALVIDRGKWIAYTVVPPKKCVSGTECTSGFCVDNFCCDSACAGQCEACDVANAIGKCTGVSGAPHGAREECSPPYTPACRALACDPTRSRTECVAPVFKPPCDCTRDDECESGHCADGVCCNTACDGQCEACDLPDARGVCTPVVGEPRGVRKGCAPAGRSICSIQACNGVDTKQCVFTKGSETACDTICGGQVQRHCSSGVCGLPSELRCPDESCSIRAVEPAVARWSDAVWVVIAAACVQRLRRRRA